MLTTRPTRRDKGDLFGSDMLFDILDEGRPIGSLVYDKEKLAAALTLDGKDYSVARTSERPDEGTTQALLRVMTGADKPPANPWALKDAGGGTLALAEPVKQDFAVSRREESFSFRKKSRPYHLYRQDSEQSLGSVGQQKFFSRTLHMNLPTEFDAPFQVFLLVLLLNLTMQAAEARTRSR